MRKILMKIPGAVKRRILWSIDLLRYARRALPYRAIANDLPPPMKGSLLIIAGRAMNISWGQIWSLMSLPLRMRGYHAMVLTARRQRLLNSYFRLLKLELLFLDDMPVTNAPPEAVKRAVDAARSNTDCSAITYKNAPVGQIALSTYSRNNGTGLIRYEDPAVRVYINNWIYKICGYIDIAEALFTRRNVRMLFCTEVFMEEFGAFYYAALNAKLNIIRFAGTIRDNAFIMQHLALANDRIHHSSLDKTTWEQLKLRTDDADMEAELTQNFADRYGTKWHRSKRNHPNTLQLDVATAREQLGVAPGRKVAVIYSHILYDTLFFFGTDLFADYSQWLVETVRAAIANPHIDWLVKVHPSNLWRGEMDSLLKGCYEEERLLQKSFGTLPPHVRIVGADTKINPLTWFKLADYGITVRGTSGLEMAALGKTVICAGTGRYEGNGFTVDPATAEEYLTLLKNIHTLPEPTAEQVRLGKRYAHAIFTLKPFTLASFDAVLKTGCRKVHASDDLIYLPKPLVGATLGHDLQRFANWAEDFSQRDLLTYPSDEVV